MAGKQAKLLSPQDVRRVLRHVKAHRYPERDRVIVLLSVKAGLRAAEIAQLSWPMVLDAQGRVGAAIELHDRIAKKRSGRMIPMNPELRKALVALRRCAEKRGDTLTGSIIQSERRRNVKTSNDYPMRATAIVCWFARLYRHLGLHGCSSHSGRRTFITNAARLVHKVGGSLRDVQQLAGHRSIDQTQAYIDGFARAKQRLVSLI